MVGAAPIKAAIAAVIFLLVTCLHASDHISGNGDGGDDDERQVCIVYMGHPPAAGEKTAGGFSVAHHELLSRALDLDHSSAHERIVYSYQRTLNGFAARLTKDEKEKLSSMEGVVSIFPSRTHQPLTTRSWDFLGFPQTVKRSLELEGDVIIGMLDTGLWPDSPSFSDEGFGPPPSRWKGACLNFTCNNKIIGARAYNHGSSTGGLSAVDTHGHGTHTASTVAGRAVGNVSLGGLAAGTARGAVPGARLAIYKVCSDDGCSDADMLAGFDDAVADGVDVISFSIGSNLPFPYFEDVGAIGSFHAMRGGVLTSAAAGNSGLESGRVSNVAPWILSVAASSTDRRLVDRLVLGNGKTIVGASINIFPELKNVPFVLPINGSCEAESLAVAGRLYKGKILLCAFTGNGSGPATVGAAGAVIVTDQPDVAFSLPLPAVMVSQHQFSRIMAYVNRTRNPVGTILASESAFDSQAPIVASFSSPGPNMITPSILKPDLSAPGIDILAAWSPLSPVSGRSVAYSIDSGTSMACPHATGAAAYVKSFHPDWSPAMIMSALITTATPMNSSRNRGGGELTYGAGQLNPVRARDPGLVYDAREGDYVRMLCAQGYNSTQLRLVTDSDDAAPCRGGRGGSAADLNYPTMAVRAAPGKNFSSHFPRTVTNVGVPGSVYVAKLVSSRPELVGVAVSPRRLAFSQLGQRLSFTVTVSGALAGANEFVSAAVVWSDGDRHVRSPVIVHTVDV
ncbi:subtilisin-like protease SBT4.9 [Triticum dicoccoides]|nr:subtilisin-like protease SBT4.9 [Triticum dicoccoides]